MTKDASGCTIALAGNPNVGKSTLFNHLTKLRQHTGNWPGKTVELARGTLRYRGSDYILVDLPGTYSIVSHSPEEEVARDFLRSGQADVAVVVCDATCLERSLNLALQVQALFPRTVVCVNLMDEAQRKGIQLDLPALEQRLGMPVVATEARRGRGVDNLMEAVARMAASSTTHRLSNLSPVLSGEPSGDGTTTVREAERLVEGCISCCDQGCRRQQRLDTLLTGRFTGLPLMLLLLGLVLWLTIAGANVPSRLLSGWLFGLEPWLTGSLAVLGAPIWLQRLLVEGCWRVLAWVISVMLPPMAIFFPLFTLLEDLGYLPRVAFNLDHLFQRCHACGKQALTLCMGLGCNAAGVTGCRIIDSPRERLIAILTNALIPCNGRFPPPHKGKVIAQKTTPAIAAMVEVVLQKFFVCLK